MSVPRSLVSRLGCSRTGFPGRVMAMTRRLSREVGHSHAVEFTAQLDVHAADHERTLSHREGADNLEAEGGADEPWRGEIHCGTDVFETEADATAAPSVRSLTRGTDT